MKNHVTAGCCHIQPSGSQEVQDCSSVLGTRHAGGRCDYTRIKVCLKDEEKVS